MRPRQNAEGVLDKKIPPAHLNSGDIAGAESNMQMNGVEGVHGGRDLNSVISNPSSNRVHSKDTSFIIDPSIDLEKQEFSPVHPCPSVPPSVQERSQSTSIVRQVSKDVHGNIYPEGGLRAWLVVYGAFSGMTASFGLMNSVGTFQAYLSTHQLSGQAPATIGWVFSIYTFLSFFLGIQIGPLFDAKGPRVLVFTGTLCMLGGTIGIAESTSKKPFITFARQTLTKITELWHFILSFSIAAGLGTALIFTPAVASIAHFFLIKRAAATGLAATGGSFGGIVYPLMLQKLFPEVGFRWAVRILALIFLVQLTVANILLRSRLPPPPKGSQAASIWPDWKIYKNITFCLTTAGTFFVEWALFVPLSYLTAYALKEGVDLAFSYQILAILNAGSFLGRWLPGIFADKFGRFNAMIVTVAICMLSVICLWLTASLSSNIVPQLIVFALIFGFGSGSNISLVPVCVGQLCETEVFGRWYASKLRPLNIQESGQETDSVTGLYTIVSFGCLTGIPVAGAILDHSHGEYTGLICFVGVCYALGLASFGVARVREVGWSIKRKY